MRPHAASAAVVSALLLSLVQSVPAQVDNELFLSARRRMVAEDIVAAGIKNPRVVNALLATPRHAFVPRQLRHQAYYDMAIPIGGQQTISPPFVVAYMTERLDPQPTDKVLEIGTGSGYQAAVLSPLVAEVYTIEIVESLGRRAAAILRALGYSNIHTKIGDGFQGWTEHAPFDKIIVTCSPEDIPQPLVDQLADDGKLIIPLGERYRQALCLFEKKDGRLERRELQATFFVPMTGVAEEQRETQPETPLTELANGGFEETLEDGRQPAGWYYLRQDRLETDDAPEGEQYLTLSNVTPGRSAHGMQAFGVDGRKVRHLELSLWVRGERLRAGQSPQEQPRVFWEFYDQQRAPVAHGELGPWEGSFDWRRQSKRIAVPRQARLAVLALGLLGGTGSISVDDVRIKDDTKR